MTLDENSYPVMANRMNWDEFLRTDPVLAKLEIGIAWCARIMVTESESSPAYARAVREYHVLRDKRRQLWLSRADEP